MSPHQYLAALRRFWWIVVAMTVLGSLAALGLSTAATPQYTATSTLYFVQISGSSAVDVNQGATYTQNQMLSYALLAKSPTVLIPVVSKLGLDATPDDLANSVTVTTPQNTVIMEAAVTNRDPALAAHIANELAKSIASAVAKISPPTTEKSGSTSVHIIASASTPTVPSSPDTRRNLLVGGLIGLLVGVLVILLRERLDFRVRSADALATVTTAPLLGMLTRQKERRLSPASDGLNFQNLESCRRVSAHLSGLLNPDQKLSMLVTSSIPGEGKSRIVLGLANTLAERGLRVLIMDTDFRHPAIAHLTALDDAAGLTNVLVDGVRYQSVVQAWGQPGLDVLVSGPPVPQPGQLVASDGMSTLIEKLKTSYDVLVIDTAPVNSVADAVILGALVDGSVMVADSSKVVATDLAEALDSLAISDVPLLGVVLSRMRRGGRTGTYPAHWRASMKSAGRSIVSWITFRGPRQQWEKHNNATIEAEATQE